MALLVVLVLLLVGYLLTLAFHCIENHERAVVHRLGRVHRIAGPGLLVIIPGLERVQRLPAVDDDVPVDRQPHRHGHHE